MNKKGISIITLDTLTMIVIAVFLFSLAFSKTTSFDELTIICNAKAGKKLVEIEKTSLMLELIWTKGKAIYMLERPLEGKSNMSRERVKVWFDELHVGGVGSLYGEADDVILAYNEKHRIKVEVGP